MADTKISAAADITTLAGTDKFPVARPASTTAYFATLAELLTYVGTTLAPKASPTFTGTVTIPVGASISGFAPLASPTFTGTPTLPTGTIATTQSALDSTTKLATTAFTTTAIAVEASRATTAEALLAPLASPTFTGTPTLPTGTIATTQSAADSTTKVATTAFVTTADNLKAPLASPTFTGTPTLPTGTIATTQSALDSTTKLATTAFTTTAIAVETTARIAADAGQLSNLGLAFNTTTPLSIAAGTCTDSTGAATITLGAFTKSISGSWAAGSAGNGMGSGLTATLSTWYHVFAVIVAGVADVYFDTSVTAANKPASTTAFRRISSIRLNASAQITPFDQYADRTDWRTPVNEYNGAPGVTTAVTLTLANVPAGVIVEALLTGSTADSTTPQNVLYLSSLAQADLVPVNSSATTANSGATTTGAQVYSTRVMTNTSGQIRRRVTSTTGNVNINSNGWIDTRGRG